ncbi:MAG: ribosomal protein S18 acetylase RimI-like enzyme [Cellvibrionaceae bacterium]|jgi:ribosomal protein S18 acetylase RimI-like enzyme
MNFKIINATAEDVPAMLPHFPRLADFELPPNRKPNYFWEGDALVLTKWAADGEPSLLVQKAIDVDGEGILLGFTLTRMGEELLSHRPSAHLEVIVVTKAAEGQGIAKALIGAAEENAKTHGAESMTLHVIATNKRARQVYQHLGYYEEIVRNIKHF